MTPTQARELTLGSTVCWDNDPGDSAEVIDCRETFISVKIHANGMVAAIRFDDSEALAHIEQMTERKSE